MKPFSEWIGSIKGDKKPAKVVSATSELKDAAANGEDGHSISYSGGSKSSKQPKMSIIRRMGMVVDKALVKGFAGLARFVARHPYATIVSCIILTMILAVGFVRINMVTSLETLYSAPSLPEYGERVRVVVVCMCGSCTGQLQDVGIVLSLSVCLVLVVRSFCPLQSPGHVSCR